MVFRVNIYQPAKQLFCLIRILLLEVLLQKVAEEMMIAEPGFTVVDRLNKEVLLQQLLD